MLTCDELATLTQSLMEMGQWNLLAKICGVLLKSSPYGHVKSDVQFVTSHIEEGGAESEMLLFYLHGKHNAWRKTNIEIHPENSVLTVNHPGGEERVSCRKTALNVWPEPLWIKV